MRRHEISDADLDRLKDLLPRQPGGHGGVVIDTGSRRDTRRQRKITWHSFMTVP